MKKLSILIAGILAVVLGTGCSTDFEVNAPYKEITVVYGLLNQKDSAHYVKITKGFLGEGDALEMAKNGDSISYQPGDLDVKLIRLSDNAVHPMQAVQINKSEGVFGTSPNYIWKTTAQLDESSKYKLEIKNNKTGTVLDSETPLIKDFAVTKPAAILQEISLKGANKYERFEFEWVVAENGKVYEPLFRFNYKEKDLTTGITTNKHVDIKLSEQRDDGKPKLSATMEGVEFFQTLQTYIPVNSNVKRWAHKDSLSIDLLITVGAPDLSTYIDVSKPGSGIIQEKPEFTNITNGIGIFSARFVKVITGKTLKQDSVNELADGQYTGNIFDLP